MKTLNTQIRPSTLAAVLAGATLLTAPSASAQVTVANGILTINAPAGGLNSKIIAGPAPGTVQLLQVPGARNGQRLSGIRGVRVMSGAGPDNLEFEITQNTPFEVFADTGAGNSDIKVKWLVPISTSPVNPRVTLRQGAGTKKVWLDFESRAETVDLDWTVQGSGTGTGEAKALIAFQPGSLRSSADLVFNMGTGVDKLDLVVDSKSDDLKLGLVSRAAEMVTTQVIANDPGTNLDIAYDVIGTARPNFNELLIDSAISNVSIDYLVDGGAQTDEIKFTLNQVAPGNVVSRIDVDAGLGLDKIEFNVAGQPSALTATGLIQGGAGNDEIKFMSEWDTTSDLFIAGGDGHDLLLAEIKGALSSTESNPLRLFGGAGNDHLLLKADGGVLGLPPLLDGGTGTDSVAGPGTILNAEILP
jgi:hypothetical protein